jgi:D-alanyl-D-alanine carboxypeptidase/D-alanyl-D-alanine-endopeptidase (penicillin-binding protein 4)
MRRIAICWITIVVLTAIPAVAHARAAWKSRIDRMVSGYRIGVAVREAGRVLYRHSATAKRIPASNQKLLMSMALLDRLGPDHVIETTIAGESTLTGELEDDLWILGRGDPTITSERQYTKSLPVAATKIRAIARAIRDAGIDRIRGSVIGDTGYFARDWFAPGWKADFPREQCPLPSALTINGNTNDQGHHVADPELRAARALTRRLRRMGIRVGGPPAAGESPPDLTRFAAVESAPVSRLLKQVNRNSANFFAEVLGKRLGVEAEGKPGTIAKGAAAIEAWARRHNVTVVARDSSGLSYDNRVSPLGLVRLLGAAEDENWGTPFRQSLAEAGRGTLDDRLNGIRVRAKTGSLQNVSALSGYVWLRRSETWGEFSILSSGMAKSTAVSIENRIVRILTRSAR